MLERDIIHQSGDFWVCREHNKYTVMRDKLTHSITDSSYAKTPEGLSVAIVRCNYLAANSTSN